MRQRKELPVQTREGQGQRKSHSFTQRPRQDQVTFQRWQKGWSQEDDQGRDGPDPLHVLCPGQVQSWGQVLLQARGKGCSGDEGHQEDEFSGSEQEEEGEGFQCCSMPSCFHT